MELSQIPLSKIVFGTRKREDYGDIEDLALSIQQKELINPITVTKQSDGTYLLVAGGRRLTACKHLKHETIACRIYDHELNELELRSIEIEENIKRKDFTFLEECTAKRDLLRIQQEIHGEKISRRPDGDGVSMRDIASMLGVSPAALSQDIKLAETVNKFPQLGWEKCRNKSEALKLKQKIDETMLRGELAKRAEQAMGSKNLFLQKLYKSYQICDCREGIKQFPDDYFNLVEIDPPYAIDLQSQKKNHFNNATTEAYNEIPIELYTQFMREIFQLCYQKMATNSWLICWFAIQYLEQIYQLMIEVGLKPWKIPAIWNKQNGQTSHPSIILGSAYEPFIYAQKGAPVLCREGQQNIFTFSRVPPAQQTHPTERPMDLIREILSTFAFENSKVLVPFAGSGNTILAAAQLKMPAFGFDLSKEYRDSFIMKVNSLFEKEIIE